MTEKKRKMLFLWVASLVLARGALGAVLAFWLPPISVDDYFRVFHALWWFDHPSFSSSFYWLPGYQYVYGLVVGFSGDTILAPRFLTLGLHLATGLFFLFIPGMTRSGCLWLIGIFYFSPLSVMLGTVPVSETLGYFYVVIHLVFLSRFLAGASVVTLFVSSIALFGAATVRYELWLLLIPFLGFAAQKQTVDASISVKWAILLFPLVFPVVWILHGAAAPEGIFSFLGSVRDDHMGPGSPVTMLSSPLGRATVIQLLVALVFTWQTRRTGVNPFWRVVWIEFLLLILVVLGLSVANSLPSQFTERIMYGPLVVSTVLTGASIASLSVRIRVALCCIFVSLAVWGAGVAFGARPGVEAENLKVAHWVKSGFADGSLAAGDHVLVSHQLPDSTAILILSNQIDRVHIDAMEQKCTLGFLSEYQATCALPGWGSGVQVIVLWKQSMEAAYVETLAWIPVLETRHWRVYRRPPGAEFPILNKPIHPLLDESLRWQDQ